MGQFLSSSWHLLWTSFLWVATEWMGTAPIGVAVGVMAYVTERWRRSKRKWIPELSRGALFVICAWLLLVPIAAIKITYDDHVRLVRDNKDLRATLRTAQLQMNNEKERADRSQLELAAALARIPATPIPPQPKHYTAVERERLTRLLFDIADILDKQAGPMLAKNNGVLSALRTGTGRGRGFPLTDEDFKSTLASARGEIPKLEFSLRKIMGDNQMFQEELATLVGDTAPLAELNSSLEIFSDALIPYLEDRETIVKNSRLIILASGGFQNALAKANEWMAGCTRRIEDKRRTLPRE